MDVNKTDHLSPINNDTSTSANLTSTASMSNTFSDISSFHNTDNHHNHDTAGTETDADVDMDGSLSDNEYSIYNNNNTSTPQQQQQHMDSQDVETQQVLSIRNLFTQNNTSSPSLPPSSSSLPNQPSPHMHTHMKQSKTITETHSDNESESDIEEKLSCGELECPLCFRLFFEPITLPCGHTFDRGCLSRVFDHTDKCPLCREVIHIVPEKVPISVSINTLVQKYFGKVYEKRKQEKDNESKINTSNIPIFVLDYVLYPHSQLPLHIFEPRYRLMMRRCISGSKRFGLVACGPDGEISKYGTIARIDNSSLLPDGRSLVETVGEKRFKLLKRWETDGYMCGQVEWIDDTPLLPNQQSSLLDLASKGHSLIRTTLNQCGHPVREAIMSEVGQIPDPKDPSTFSFWLASILPLSTETKIDVLKETDPHKRLTKLVSFSTQIINRYKHESNNSCFVQ